MKRTKTNTLVEINKIVVTLTDDVGSIHLVISPGDFNDVHLMSYKCETTSKTRAFKKRMKQTTMPERDKQSTMTAVHGA